MPTALERGEELLLTKIKDLPPLAWQFAQHLCQQGGGCGEVFLTAYAVYAQEVEGLLCDDPLYQSRSCDKAWFEEHAKCPPTH